MAAYRDTAGTQNTHAPQASQQAVPCVGLCEFKNAGKKKKKMQVGYIYLYNIYNG